MSTINIQFFARLREMAGTNMLQLDIPQEGFSVASLLTTLKNHPDVGESVSAMTVLTAVNQTMARAEDHVMPGDEVALFPPVTGG